MPRRVPTAPSRRVLWALAALLLLANSAVSVQVHVPAASAASTMSSMSANRHVVRAIEVADSGNYTNPVVPLLDLPDPGVYLDVATGVYYATTTSQRNPNAYPIRTSRDLVDWTLEGYIFPNGSWPKWAVTDFWAPEIHAVADFHLAVFAARDSTGVLCVGAAVSRTGPLGPYADLGAPLVRNASVGNIDPTVYYDAPSGTYYLIWKEDGNGAVPPEPHTPIWLQPLGIRPAAPAMRTGRADTADGPAVFLTGTRRMLMWNDLPWEGPLVEAPWLVRRHGIYYLFFSANAFYNASYAVGVARARSPLGPFDVHPLPVLHSNAVWAGPGHCAVVPAPGGGDAWALVYHAWRVPHVGGAGDARLLMVDALVWDAAGWPRMATGTASPSVGPVPRP